MERSHSKNSPLYKVVLIGESDVGKSSTFVRFRDGKFVDNLKSTIGLDHVTREITFQKNDSSATTTTGKAQIQLWDTAGLERTGFMTNNYYVHSKGVILMYDVTDSTTLNHLQGWLDDAKQYCPRDQSGSLAKFFLVGNKIDCSSSEMDVKKETAINFAKRFNIPQDQVFRISCKTGKGLDGFLNTVAMILTQTTEPVRKQKIIFDEDDEDRNTCSC